ncbi:MAG: dihydrofolate reductase [Clostridia bacterium]|nr:dihydrofolate reductase [Clostridia bacterium]
MFCIVATDQNRGIGKSGELLAHLPGDLKYFKEKTAGKTVIMGYNTLLSLPKSRPLPNRRNIVLCHLPDVVVEGAEVCHTVEEVLALVRDLPTDDVAVMGGGMVYQTFLPYCDKALITEIDASWDADTFFPPLDGFTLVSRSEPQRDGDVTYTFCIYERK